MPLTEPPIFADEGTLAEAIIARFSELDPTWDPGDLDIETMIAEAIASPVATAMEILRLNARSAYAEVIGRVLRTERGVAIASSAIVTITVDTTAGVTIPAGEPFGLMLGGEELPFILPVDVDIPSLSNTATGVALIAADVGEFTVGATSPVSWGHARITAVTVTASAAGGADEQEEDAYLEQLERRGRRVSFAPVTAGDYAAAALDLLPAGSRVAFLNRFDPTDPLVETEGHVGLWTVNADGTDHTTEQMDAVADAFAAAIDDQPLNTTVHVDAPVRENLTWDIEVEGAAGFSELEIQTAVKQAIVDTINDSVWDYDATAPGLWTPTAAVVRNYDGAAAIDDLLEVSRVVSVEVNGGDSVLLDSDPVVLPAVALEDITVTVS